MSSTLNAYGTTAQSPFAAGGIFSFATPMYPMFQQLQNFGYMPAQGVASTDPNAMAALQNSFVSQGGTGLAAITSLGAAELQGVAGLFSGWGNNLNTQAVQAGSIFQTIANKSARACSGFFGCML